MNELEKLKRMIQEHEDRITKLEDNLISKKSLPNNFKGIKGGIQLLIRNKFFNAPKSSNEIIKEMKINGFVYDKSSIENTLRKDFLENNTLQKIPEDTKWKYVVTR